MAQDSIANKLSELFDLFNSGMISKEEYDLLKSEILNNEESLNKKKTGSKKQDDNLQILISKALIQDKIKSNPLSKELHHEYAQLLVPNQLFEEEIAAYNLILEIDGKDQLAKVSLSDLYFRLGSDLDALKAGEQLLLNNSSDISLLEKLAKLSSNLGNTGKANEYYDIILKLEPSNKDALKNKGITFIKINQLVKACEIYKDLYVEGDRDRIPIIYAGIEKPINGEYEAGNNMLSPLFSDDKQTDINNNRRLLYLIFCLSQKSISILELVKRYSAIDFKMLKQNYHRLYEQTAIKIIEYIIKHRLNDINLKDDPESKIERLKRTFLQNDYFTINCNSQIADIWYSIGNKQVELKLLDHALISFQKSIDLLPNETKYTKKYVDIKDLIQSNIKKKTRQVKIVVFSIISAVIIINFFYLFIQILMVLQSKKRL